MKNIIAILFALFIVSGFISCKKIPLSPTPTIVGNWSVVKDSANSSGWGLNTSGATSAVYIGTASDHFNFTSAGKLYVHEGDVISDTASYTVKADTVKLKYSYFETYGTQLTGVSDTYTISNLSTNSLTLKMLLITPEAVYNEVITLKKD
jgi:hypothetical protein